MSNPNSPLPRILNTMTTSATLWVLTHNSCMEVFHGGGLGRRIRNSWSHLLRLSPKLETLYLSGMPPQVTSYFLLSFFSTISSLSNLVFYNHTHIYIYVLTFDFYGRCFYSCMPISWQTHFGLWGGPGDLQGSFGTPYPHLDSCFCGWEEEGCAAWHGRLCKEEVKTKPRSFLWVSSSLTYEFVIFLTFYGLDLVSYSLVTLQSSNIILISYCIDAYGVYTTNQPISPLLCSRRGDGYGNFDIST